MNKAVLHLLFFTIIIFFTPDLIAQKTITGSVTGIDGEKLPGVSVIINGTTTGVISDVNGLFSIMANPDDTLKLSFIGYKTYYQPVGNQTNINILMEESIEVLDEVVVIGYGTMKKVNLTGAVSNIKFDEKLTSRSLANVSTALTGMVPGLAVRQSSGMPGNNDTEILIRGLGSVNNSNPLVVVDGIPDIDIDRIDMNDVESISILKDASSSSVYGSRAANGVILISTKSGKNTEPKIRYFFPTWLISE